MATLASVLSCSKDLANEGSWLLSEFCTGAVCSKNSHWGRWSHKLQAYLRESVLFSQMNPQTGSLCLFLCKGCISFHPGNQKEKEKKIKKGEKKRFFKILMKYCLLQWQKLFLKSCNLLTGTKRVITTKWCSGAQIPESQACSQCTSLKYYEEWNTACLEFVSVQAVIARCSNSNTQSRKFMLVPCLSHHVHSQWWQCSCSASRTFF